MEIEGEDGRRTTIGVHGGFIQVLHNRVTLITDRARIAEDQGSAREVAKELAETAESVDE